MAGKIFLFFLLFIFVFPKNVFAVWYQDNGNAQRTGYTPEEPVEPWTLVWTWNGPDSNGGTGNHFYDVGSSQDNGGNSPMWEGRTVMGGNYIYVPALINGLYALNKTNGQQAWRVSPLSGASMKATPAYDSTTQTVFVGDSNGILYKINANTGATLNTYNAGNPLNKAIMIVGASVYAITDSGQLHKVRISDMTSQWMYSANSGVATSPAYSTSRDVIIYATDDLYIHAVRNTDGSQGWRVKPSPSAPSNYIEFEGGWPVVAENHGLVFLRMSLGVIGDVISRGGGLRGIWPLTNAEISQRLITNPQYKTLFALNLDNGQETFVPAVAPSGVESLTANSPRLKINTFPVIKVLADGSEVAYSIWQNGQLRSDAPWASYYDGRSDSHLGEMLLDNNTLGGYLAGDLRFVKFNEYGYFSHITDEGTPLTMAGNTIFNSHWGAAESAMITDRSSSLGGVVTNPINTSKHPQIVRRIAANGTQNSVTHYSNWGYQTVFDDGRTYPSNGWWVYWNILDPPTPHRGAYSEGILPRYTYVSDGLIVVEGNGGELFVLRHSGSAQPTPTITPISTPIPTVILCARKGEGDANCDGVINILDFEIWRREFLGIDTTTKSDFDSSGGVTILDFEIWRRGFLGI